MATQANPEFPNVSMHELLYHMYNVIDDDSHSLFLLYLAVMANNTTYVYIIYPYKLFHLSKKQNDMPLTQACLSFKGVLGFRDSSYDMTWCVAMSFCIFCPYSCW